MKTQNSSLAYSDQIPFTQSEFSSFEQRLRRLSPALTLIFLASTMAACSLMGPRSMSAKGAQAEIRDVPFQAREKLDLSPRKRVLVLPFIDNTGRHSRASVTARESFIRALRRTDDFVVIANSDFPKDVATYLKNSEYDLESMAKLGGSMGLAAIIEGRILEIKAKRVGDEVGVVRQVRARMDSTIQLRVVNTKNMHVAMNETKTADAEETVTRVGERAISDKFLEDDPNLIDSVVTKAFQSTIPRIQQAVQKLSWEGRVALVKGDRIYLNAGRLSGLQIGDILKVTEEGEDVYDPDSGDLIGKVPGRLKGTVEVISYFGKDGSIGLVHSGSGFRENDRVELY